MSLFLDFLCLIYIKLSVVKASELNMLKLSLWVEIENGISYFTPNVSCCITKQIKSTLPKLTYVKPLCFRRLKVTDSCVYQGL